VRNQGGWKTEVQLKFKTSI